MSAEVNELFFFGEKKHHLFVVLHFAEASGVVVDAVVDALELKSEYCLFKVGLEVILEGRYKYLLLAPSVTDAEGIEHEGDGKRAEGFIVDGNEIGGVGRLALSQGVGEIVIDALAKGVGERELVGLEFGNNGLCHGITVFLF